MKKVGAKKGEPYGKLAKNDHAIFEYYYEVRSLVDVAKKYGVSTSGIEKHAQKMGWKKRLEERDQKVRIKTDQTVAEKMAKDTGRLYDILTWGELNAGNMLNHPNIDKGGFVPPSRFIKAIDGLDKIIRNKRLLAGETTENQGLTLKDAAIAAQRAEEADEQRGRTGGRRADK